MAEPGSREQVLEALKPLGPVMARPELGGTGLLLNGAVFGVLHGGLVYLKVDKKLREEYHAAGMRPLEPRPKQKLPAFLEVPQAVVDDAAKLLEHAARAAGRPLPGAGPKAGAKVAPKRVPARVAKGEPDAGSAPKPPAAAKRPAPKAPAKKTARHSKDG